MKIYEHLNSITKLLVAEDVIQALEGSGFENLLKMVGIGTINQCRTLVKQLARCYDEKSHCLSLYLSLVDILCIVGLSISGNPLIGNECHGPSISQDLFESIPGAFIHNKGFVLSVLKTVAINDEYPLDTRVRATKYNVEDVGKFAWGDVCLTEIHDALVEYKTKLENGKEASIRGAMFTVMIFALIRIRH